MATHWIAACVAVGLMACGGGGQGAGDAAILPAGSDAAIDAATDARTPAGSDAALDVAIDAHVPAGSDGAVPAPAALVVEDGSGAVLAELAFAATPVGSTTTQLVHVTNRGGMTALMLAVATSGTQDFQPDAATTTCVASLAPGASCDVGVDFQPSALGERTGTLVVGSQSGASATIALAGSGAARAVGLEVSPSLIALGTVAIGTSDTVTITISNTGSASGAIGAATIRTSGAEWSLGASSCTTSLAAGASCTIAAVFTPTNLGATNNALQLALAGSAASVPLTATGGGEVTVSLAGDGSGTVTSSPGGIACGSSCSAAFSAALQLRAQAAAGSTFVGWSVGTSTTTSMSLSASTTTQTVTATFALTTDPPPTELYVAPSSLDFGTLTVGSGRVAELTAINDNSTAVVLTTAVSGSDYSLNAGCGGALAAGAQCEVQVTLNPTTLGAHPGTLDVVVNGTHHTSTLTGAGGTFVTVAVIGDPASTVASSAPGLSSCNSVCGALVTGDVTFTAQPSAGAAFVGWSLGTCGASPTCTVPGSTSPQTIRAFFSSATSTPPIHIEPGQDIGWVEAGGPFSFSQSFTIVNDSSAAVPLDAYGPAPGEWRVDSGTCGASLPAMTSCTVTGSFDAQNIGDGLGATFDVVTGGVRYSSRPLDDVGAIGLGVTALGHGRVTGALGIACPGFCEELTLEAGDTLTAAPDAGFTVQHWELELTTNDTACSGGPSQCAIKPGGFDPFATVIFVPQ